MRQAAEKETHLGTPGRLAIFVFSLASVMLPGAAWLPWMAAVSLVLAGLTTPQALRGVARPRWLVMIGLLVLPSLFLAGPLDRSLGGLPYSSAGLTNALLVSLRMLVVLVAVQGVTSAVDITSLAGLVERLGLHGLGFSVGVALNLLPSLLSSAQNAWHSLWMRGGLRRRRARSLRLLAVTIAAGALARAEEISLAAEVRAFSPENARALPVTRGRLDGWVAVGCAFAVLAIVMLAR